jgi:hypothetical protein
MSRFLILAILLSACGDNVTGDDDPPPSSQSCGDGVVQAELGEECDGIATATCDSGVGRPVCTSTCVLDRASCGPAADVVELSAHRQTSCARLADGTISCWGYNRYQNAMPPPRGAIRQWSVGNIDGYLDPLRLGEDGRVHGGVQKLLTLQADEIVAIAMQTRNGTCGLRGDGAIVCTLEREAAAPNPTLDISTPDRGGTYQQLWGTTDTLCGVSTANALTCWQYDATTRRYATTVAEQVPVGGPLVDLDVVDSAAGRAVVYVTGDGTAHVLGTLPAELALPDARWQNLSFAPETTYACGATVDGVPRCWGKPATVPSPLDVRTNTGVVRVVEVFWDNACSLGATGALRCWGGGGAPRVPVSDRDDVADIHVIPSSYRTPLAIRTMTGSIYVVNSGYTPMSMLLFEDGPVQRLVGDDALGNFCATRAGSRPSCWGRDGLRPSSSSQGVDVFARLRFCGRSGSGLRCQMGTASIEEFADADTGWQSLVPTDSWLSPLCGRRADGTYSCALDAAPYSAQELGSFEHARAATEYFCGQTADAIECTPAQWINLEPPRMPFTVPGHYRDFRPISGSDIEPDLPIITLAESGEVACQRPTSTVDPTCTGFDVEGHRFRSIDTTCGITEAGSIHCWTGAPSPHQLFGVTDVEAPLTLFNSHGGGLFCAGYADGLYRCGAAGHAVDTPLVDIRPGGYLSCGRTREHVLSCWATYATLNADILAWLDRIPKDLVVDAYSVGSDNICAITSDGALTCWSWTGDVAPPAGRFTAVSVGILQACALDTDHHAVCWKLAASAPGIALDGTFEQLVTGRDFACGLANGDVRCAMADGHVASADLQLVPRHHDFTTIAAGTDHVCGLRAGGFIGCFGSNLQGQSSPPLDGGYVDVTSGEQYSCAAKPGAPVRCWGSMRYE